MNAKESRARLFGLLGRTEILRRDSWEMDWGFMAGVGLGVSRAWYTKVRFQAGKHLGGGRELRSPGGW